MLLQSEPGMHVVGEVGDAEEALRMIELRRPDVLVIDLNMPGRKTLAVIPEVERASPGTRVVVLTMQDDAAYARSAMRAGAAGYVLKDSADDELVAAIRAAAAGNTYLNPTLGARLAVAAPEVSGLPDGLTEREADILRLIALGHTNTEIAEQLFLSVRTVESHRAHVQQKLNRSTRAELVRYALDHDLIDR
jgi:two-component system response regulator NreC